MPRYNVYPERRLRRSARTTLQRNCSLRPSPCPPCRAAGCGSGGSQGDGGGGNHGDGRRAQRRRRPLPVAHRWQRQRLQGAAPQAAHRIAIRNTSTSRWCSSAAAAGIPWQQQRRRRAPQALPATMRWPACWAIQEMRATPPWPLLGRNQLMIPLPQQARAVPAVPMGAAAASRGRLATPWTHSWQTFCQSWKAAACWQMARRAQQQARMQNRSRRLGLQRQWQQQLARVRGPRVPAMQQALPPQAAPEAAAQSSGCLGLWRAPAGAGS